MSFSTESIVEFWSRRCLCRSLLSDFTLGSESNEVKACLPAGRAKKSLTGPRGYSNLSYDGGSGPKTTPAGGQQRWTQPHCDATRVQEAQGASLLNKKSWSWIP